MRIGLLVCDHVRERHRGIAGDYSDHFRTFFAGHPEIELVEYDVINGQLPTSPTECDGWLTTGSRHSVNDDLGWVRDLEDFVRRVAGAGVPFVGICFGHQLLAKALGGSVVKSDRGWGVANKDVTTADGGFRVMNMHQDQVEDLPPGARVIGWNQHCPVSVMSVGDSMLGVQGHPEMPAEYTRVLLEERRGGPISTTTADEGLASLDTEPDTEWLAGWLASFFADSDRNKSHI